MSQLTDAIDRPCTRPPRATAHHSKEMEVSIEARAAAATTLVSSFPSPDVPPYHLRASDTAKSAPLACRSSHPLESTMRRLLCAVADTASIIFTIACRMVLCVQVSDFSGVRGRLGSSFCQWCTRIYQCFINIAANRKSDMKYVDNTATPCTHLQLQHKNRITVIFIDEHLSTAAKHFTGRSVVDTLSETPRNYISGR